MTISQFIPYGFSGLLVTGGLVGFSKGSKASLIASSVVAAINAYSAYVYQNNNENRAAFYGQLFCAGLRFEG